MDATRHGLAYGTLLAALALALIAPAGSHAAGPTATFSKSSDWGSGFVGHYTIHNRGSTAMEGWRLEFDLPAGERITSAWSGRLSSVGNHNVLTPEDWTRRIAPGASVEVGFEGTYLTTFGTPVSCRLDGQPCADGGPSPSAPTGLVVSAVTPTTVSLDWDAAGDDVAVTEYAVYSGQTRVATTTATSATVTGLTPSTDYSFTVRATDGAGNLSPASQPARATTAADTTGPATGPATATFSKTSDWGSGFVGEWNIRNGGTETMNGWRLEFDLPAGQTITSAWSGKLTSQGDHYVLTDEDWTRTIAPGAAVKVGVQGTYGTAFTPPARCTLNGRPCAAPDTSAPSAPTDLAVSRTTATSTALRWNPASDDVAVTGYSVYNGTAKVATTSATSTTVTGLSPATSHDFTVRAADAAGNVSPASNLVTATTTAGGGDGSTPTFAPYVDMTLSSDSLAEMMAQSGVSRFTLAFIVSGSACKASWGGYYGIDDPAMTRRIADLEAAGGEAIVSFGGAINDELALTCPSVDALAAQYQAVIDRYGIRDLDFDIEGSAQRDAASLERRAKAIAQVQAAGRAAGKPVRVSLTLPVMPTGLTHDGLGVVRSAIAAGVDIGTVNVVAMDYFDPALDYTDRMGDYAIQAAISTHDQLADLFPDRSDAELWKMIGVTPMLGINDNPDEIFTTADASKLATFAKQKGLGRLAMWSMNRDKPCPAPTRWTSNTCSGVLDGPWAFSGALG